MGGATPTMVPFNLLGGPAAPADAGLGAAPGGAAGAAGAAGPTAGGWFIINIVPLNFGAAAPLMLKPHLEQVCAVSGFWVPQFGQNTPSPRDGGAYRPRNARLKGIVGATTA